MAGCQALPVSNTNQFYGAQYYLPLPDGCLKGGSCGVPIVPAGSACAAGPVVRMAPPGTAARENRVHVLPGMTLHVTQTTYRRSGFAAGPILSDWDWTIPAAADGAPCRDHDALVPSWTRHDLLVVRTLLNGATVESNSEGESPDYFQSAVQAAAHDCNVSIDDCIREKLLEPMANGLTLAVRNADDASTGGYPAIPEEVRAGHVDPDATSATGLGVWFSDLWHRGAQNSADLFDVPVENGSSETIAHRCAEADYLDAKHQQTPNGDRHAVDAAACGFALTSLRWRSVWSGQRLPGDLDDHDDLLLLNGGDPYYLFGPPAAPNPLDLSGGQPCPTGESAHCGYASRIERGFNEIQLSVPVRVEGSEQVVAVPVGTSVTDFERDHAVTVLWLLRSGTWLPKELKVDSDRADPCADGVGRCVSVKDIAGSDNRVAFDFGGSQGLSFRRPLSLTAKADVILAPGDILTVRTAK